MKRPLGFFKTKGSVSGELPGIYFLYNEGRGKYTVKTIEEFGELREYQTDLKFFSQVMEPIEPEEVKKIMEKYKKARDAPIRKAEFLEGGLEELAKSDNNENP